jgi:hypothetical protein
MRSIVRGFGTGADVDLDSTNFEGHWTFEPAYKIGRYKHFPESTIFCKMLLMLSCS